MSEENVENVRRMIEAFHGGDADGALACFDRDVVIDTSRVAGGVGHGREELDAIMSRYLGTWEDWREEIEEIRDLGTQVYVASTQRGRGKGSGIAVENRFGYLFEIRADKITRMTIYPDPAQAREAAGLRE
jgi:ketosteroid isomerase-like protein